MFFLFGFHILFENQSFFQIFVLYWLISDLLLKNVHSFLVLFIQLVDLFSQKLFVVSRLQLRSLNGSFSLFFGDIFYLLLFWFKLFHETFDYVVVFFEGNHFFEFEDNYKIKQRQFKKKNKQKEYISPFNWLSLITINPSKVLIHQNSASQTCPAYFS